MKATKRILGVVLLAGLLIGLAFAAAMAYLPSYLEQHRDELEASATRALGRPVQIEGRLALAWSLQPSISLQELRIGNPRWAQGDIFLHARWVNVQFDLMALLRWRIEIARLVVEGAALHLETDSQNRNNWNFGSNQSGAGDFRLDTVEIRDSTVSFQPAQGQSRSIAITRANIQGLGSPHLVLDAAVMLEQIPYRITAQSGAYGHARQERWSFILQAESDHTALRAEGSSNAPFDATDLDVNLALQGQKLSALQPFIGVGGVPDWPFRLGFRLTRDDTGYRLQNISGMLHGGGRSAALDSNREEILLHGSLRWESRQSRPHMSGNLSLTAIDLNRFAGNASIPAVSKQPLPAQGTLDQSLRPSWIDQPFSLDVLATFDADLILEIGQVAAGPLQFKGVQGHALLAAGRLRLEDFRASLPGLVLTGRATVDAAGMPLAMAVELDAEQVQFPLALSFLLHPPKIEGLLQGVSLVGKAQGLTPADLIRALQAELTADRIRLRRPGEQPNTELDHGHATLAVAAGGAARLWAEGMLGQQAFSLELTGGPLFDLLPGERSWPSIQCLVNTRLHGDSVDIRAAFGPLDALLAGRDLQADITANYRQATVSLTGTVARFDQLSGSNISIKASGLNGSALEPLLGPVGSNDQPFELSAVLEGGNRSLYVQDLQVHGEAGDLAGYLRIYFDARPRIRAALAARSIDLTPYLTGGSANAGTRSWMTTDLPFASLRHFDAELRLKVDQVAIDRFQAKDLQGHLVLDNGRLQLEQVQVSLPGAALSGQATVDTNTKAPTIALSLTANEVALPQSLWFLSQPLDIAGSVKTAALNMQAQGETPALLLATLSAQSTVDHAHLNPRVQQGGRDFESSIDKLMLSVEAGQRVRLQAAVNVNELSFDLDLTGGRLIDLLSSDRSWRQIKILARGQWRGQKTEVRGAVGPLNALFSGRDLRIDLSMQHPELTAGVRGIIAGLHGLRGSKASVHASGQSLSALQPLLGLELPIDQPFDVRAQLVGGHRRLEVQQFAASLGDSDVRGSLRLLVADKPQVSATLASHSIDLTPYLTGGDGRSAAVNTSLSKTLPLEYLHGLNAVVTLTVDHLRIGEFGVDDARLSALLDTGYLHLSAKAEQERINATVVLRPESSQWRLDFRHNGKLNLAWLIEEEHARALAHLPITVDTRLSALGNTMQSLLESADGRVELVIGAGEFAEQAADLPFGKVVLLLLETLNPMGQLNPFQELQCAVVQFDVADGIATSTKGIALQTATMNVLGSGTLDLSTNEIQLYFKTVKRKGLGISLLGVAEKFISIDGTLQNPEVAIDPRRLLIEGGAAWSTGGLSLLYDQIFARLTTSGDPCAKVLQRGQ
jgi:uncharacterized protein involved in outer membrane biogenesis